ncbi:tubby C-terminal-like domain-containing protein [Catenaria anguillulae PL171]|uniref:Tubby C-terminal-like domain-containing protein n=1 Tax=Catenaria anguillulae PL171 TaxID=765915 RepID=A0A1Y2HG33_9FUNG|nr:tubby C-terminal-like domain-containing protein [Catenaria anguillulae PL171]
MKQLTHNLPIVSEGWCLPYPSKFVVEEGKYNLSSNDFKVYDPNGNIAFTFNGHALARMSEKTTMYQGNGTGGPALLNLRKQMEFIPMTAKFKVYAGSGSDGKSALKITARKMMGFIRVKAECPHLGMTFKFTKVPLSRDMSVYIDGDDSSPVAKIHKNLDFNSYFRKKDSYVIEVTAGMDAAATVALAVIADICFEDGV